MTELSHQAGTFLAFMEYRGSMETKSQITFVASFSLLQTNHLKGNQLTMSSPSSNQPDANQPDADVPDHGAAAKPNQAKPRLTVTNPYANLKKSAPKQPQQWTSLRPWLCPTYS
jgi:hypothetical protein